MEPRVVMVRRETEYESLMVEHGTEQMAVFQLKQRGVSIDEVRARHEHVLGAAEIALGRVPTTWRKTWVLRKDLDRFRFDPGDIVVAIGLDGLVPNVAKYLNGQPVIGVNPTDWPQQMMHFTAEELPELYGASEHRLEARTMVEVEMDDGRSLVALNELFCGHRAHQSAKYDIQVEDHREYQSSSGLIVATGTGATGWARSIADATGVEGEDLPAPTDNWVYYFVREAWASSFTGAELVHGAVHQGGLRITSKMQAGGTLFGDGIESDGLEFCWGQTATFRVAQRLLNLVVRENGGGVDEV